MTQEIPEELKRLYDANDSVDLAQLADTLDGLVQLHANPVEIEFTLEGEELAGWKKLLAYLLARKALQESNLIESEKITPGEIEQETGWSGGSIRPYLSRLKKEKLIRLDSSEGGGYYIPNHAFKKVSETLANQGEDT